MKRNLKAVAFDAYGTLFDVFSIGSTAEELFPGQGAALAALWRDKQLEYTRIREMSGRYVDFWQCTCDALRYSTRKLALEMSRLQEARLLDQYRRLTAFPETREVLQELQAMGMGVAILSNGTPAMLDSAVTASSLEPYLDRVLSVDSVKHFKTSPHAYQLGPDAFACPASQILFASSNGWDVAGAAWFGYTTFWVNRTDQPLEELGVSPTAVGKSLNDLLEFVRTHR